jgi:hypothetical protein
MIGRMKQRQLVVESVDVLSGQYRVAPRGRNSRYLLRLVVEPNPGGPNCASRLQITLKNVKPHKTNGVMS